MATVHDRVIRIPLSEIHIPEGWNARSGDWTKYVDPETGASWPLFVDTFRPKQINDTPIEVRPITGKGKKVYELVAGFRRVSALTEIGAKEALAQIQELDDLGARMRNIKENTDRDALKGADLAWALAEARKLSGDKLGGLELSKQITKSQPYIDKLLKIMTAVKPSITKKWRDAKVNITVAEMYRLAASTPADRQDEVFNKIIEGKAESDGDSDNKGPGSWMKTLKKKAFQLGFTLGTMKRLEYIDAVDGDWLDILENVVTIKSTATKKQRAAGAKEISKGFDAGMKPPPAEDEDEEDGEDE